MDLKNPGGKARAKSLIYMAEDAGGEGGKAPAKSLKTRRRKAEKKSPLMVPPPRRVPGLPPGCAAGVSNLSVDQLVEQISYEGSVYSVPVNIHRSNVMWFNRS